MSDRYTNRETALAAYLQAQLGASYHVTRAPSVADYPIGKRIVMLRWMGLTNDVERNTTEPVSDTCLFSLRCLPGPCVDSAADTAANEIADAVIDKIRAQSSYYVFGDADGKPCGMRVLRAAKGFVQNTGIVVDVEIEVLFEEDPYNTAPPVPPTDEVILTYREQAGQSIVLTVDGLAPGDYQARSANGTILTPPSAYAGTNGTARVWVYDPLDITSLERVKVDVKGPAGASKTVPDCATLTEAAANLAITAAGLTPDSDGAFSSTVAKGIVISQSPAAGTAAYAGDIVTITVSFGADITIGRAGADLGPMCTEWQLVQPARTNPVMTGATAPSGVASASSELGGNVAWQAFDNVATIPAGVSDWVATAGVFPSWLQYQNATAFVLKAYAITTRRENGYPVAPKSWVLAGSNDGSAWTTLDTQTDIVNWLYLTYNRKVFYITDNTASFSYYRITISAGNQNYAAIGELELYDYAALPIVAVPSKSLYLFNDGATTLTITSITAPAWLTLTGVPATLAAGATATITATVNTAVAGAYTGDITVTASDGVTVMPVTATVYAPA